MLSEKMLLIVAYGVRNVSTPFRTVGHRPPPPSAPARSGCITAQGVTPQTTPAAHPNGTGVAPRGTPSHTRGSQFPVRGASPFQPAMHDPPGFQADPPLTLSPLR